MDAAIKAIVEGPLYLVLVVAGLGFLFLAVAGKIGDRVSPDKAGRLSAAGIGAVLLLAGLVMSASAGPSPAASAAPASAPAVAPSSLTAPNAPLAPNAAAPSNAAAPANTSKK